MSFRSYLSATFLAGLLTVACTAVAQQDPMDIGLEELTGKEVVSVSKGDQSAKEALASVIVLKGEEIKRYGYRTLAEVLQRVSGLYISDDRVYQYLGVRGISTPGGYNGRILLLIDGHRINDPNYDYVPIGEDFPLDIESIDRIEIVKGTGSSMWGTNAILATINVISRRGSLIDGERVESEYGTYNRRKVFAESGGLTNGGFEHAFSFGIVRSDGESPIYYPQFDSAETNYGLSENTDGLAAQRFYSRLSYDDINFLAFASRREKGASGGPWDAIFNSQCPSIDETYDLELNATRSINDSSVVFMRAYHDYITYHSPSYYPDYQGGIVLNKSSSSSRVAGAEARLQGDLGKVRYTLGTEFQAAYDMNLKNEDLDPYLLYYNSHGTYRLFSVYTEESAPIAEGLNLVLGGRFDKYSISKHQLSPRAGIIYEFSPQLTAKLIYGRAFRIPNNSERTATIAESDPNFNPSLQPEVGKGWEGVLMHRISSEQKLQLSLYSYKFEDLIETLANEYGSSWSENIGTARSQGADLWWSNYGEGGLLWYLGASYTDARAEGKHLVNSPWALASAGASIPFFSDRWYLSPETRYIGALQTLRDTSIPAATIFNLTLGSKKLFWGLDASFSVYDIFASNNGTVVGSQYQFDRAPSEGRTWRVQVGKSF